MPRIAEIDIRVRASWREVLVLPYLMLSVQNHKFSLFPPHVQIRILLEELRPLVTTLGEVKRATLKFTKIMAGSSSFARIKATVT